MCKYTYAYFTNSPNPTNPLNWLCYDCMSDVFPFNQRDHTSFHLIIYQNVFGAVHFDTDRLENLCFNPMEYMQHSDKFIDLDPDSIIFIGPAACDYLHDGRLSKLTANKNSINLSVLHIDARSLYGNFDKVKQLLGLSNHRYTAIGVWEAWLNTKKKKIKKSNYLRYGLYTGLQLYFLP